MYPDLHQALSQILDRIDQTLRESGYSGKPVRMYLAGGLAMNWYCASRYTGDIDAFFDHRLLLPENLEAAYKRADGTPDILYFDTQYNPTLGLMHEDAMDDAVFCQDIGNERRLVHLYVLTPIDLAVSKVARFGDQDRDDILLLARRGLITAEQFRARAGEAIVDYVGNLAAVRNSVTIIAEKIREIDQTQRPRPGG